MSINLNAAFKEIVENVFSRWTALKLAVEHGMGGHNGLERAIEIVNYVAESCMSNQNVSESDLVDLLEDIMDEEFDTVCDDGSTREVSQVLLKLLHLLRSGQLEVIKQELNQMGPCEIWIRPGHKIVIKKTEDDSSSESDEDEEMDIPEDSPVPVTVPSTSGSTIQMEEEDVEPGWTVVKTKRKNK